jgi:outer membrane protein
MEILGFCDGQRKPFSCSNLGSDLQKNCWKKNPAYQSVIAEIKAQEKREDMARADYLPTLNGSYSWSTFIIKLGKDNGSTISFSDQFSQNKISL